MYQNNIVGDFLKKYAASQEFMDFMGDSLIRICEVNSTPASSIADLRSREEAVFKIVIDLLEGTGLHGEILKYPVVLDEIEKLESYTPLHYTDEEEPYQGRYNLVFHYSPELKSDNGRPLAFNAHIDTVHPHIPPVRIGSVISGRGSADDKGNIINMIGIIKLLGEVKARFNMSPGNDLVFMFVIDEETGGNGSLSLAVNREVKKYYDGLVVLECCENKVFPANRGALWYKAEFPLDKFRHPLRAAMDVILALEKNGQRIKEESTHPLFPDRPVQTCHGILGPWGEHPSRICGYLELLIRNPGHDFKTIETAVERAVTRYVNIYGDKTMVERDGKKVVPRHYQLKQVEEGYSLAVIGSTGHMAAVAENDGALTKAAFIVRELVAFDRELDLAFPGWSGQGSLVLEGGQSFIPTHPISIIKNSIIESCRPVFQENGINSEEIKLFVTMDKLHNSAFSSDPDSFLYKKAVEKALDFGVNQNPSPRGWGASCDARLFWEEYPDLPIITTGPGDLNSAHSDTESLDLDDLCVSSGFLTLLAMEHTGII